MTLAYLQWTSPLWGWAALAAVALPLLAHLLSRRSGPRQVFPAARFVNQALAASRRWLRPRHYLLLALRTLLLLLVVAALARPVWYAREPALAGAAGLHAIFILDRSASMRRVRHGAELYQEAQRQLAAAVRQLDPLRDVASVVLLDADPQPLLPEPTANFDYLLAQVAAVPATFQRGELAAAVQAAAAVASRPARHGREAPRVQLHLLSDMQDAQVLHEPQIRVLLDRLPLHPHRTGVAEANLALHSPVIAPAQPVAGQPATLSVQAANYGAMAVAAELELAVGGERRRASVTVPAGGATTARFLLHPRDAGATHARVGLVKPIDNFPHDDQIGLWFDVKSTRDVVLLTRQKIDDPNTAAFFVARALAPAMDGPTRLRHAAPDPPEQLEGLLREAAPESVVLVEAGALPAAAAKTLSAFLNSGGGVLWIIDSIAAAESLAQLGSPVIQPRDGRWVGGPRATAQARFDDPLLAVLESAAGSSLLGVRFERALASVLAEGARAPLLLDDGSPALALQAVGEGHLAVLPADVGPQSSDLVKQPVFPVLLHEIVRALAPPGGALPGAPAAHPGARPVLHVPGHALGAFSALAPDGAALPLRVVETNPRGRRVQWPALEQLGPHSITDAAGRTLAGLHVSLDPAESDLRHQEVVVPRAAEADVAAAETPLLRDWGRELWPYLLAAALLLGALEPLLIGWMSRLRHRVYAEDQWQSPPPSLPPGGEEGLIDRV